MTDDRTPDHDRRSADAPTQGHPPVEPVETSGSNLSNPVDEPTLALPTPDATGTSVVPGLDGVPTSGTASSAEGHASTTATAILSHPRIAPYVAAARDQLADLPAGERSELLDDLDAHLHEILAEEGEAFEARLGSPDEYAAEFRASASYPPLASASGATRRTTRTRQLGLRVTDTWLAAGDALAARVRTLPGGPALLALLPRLRPAWWVLRAWLVAAVFGVDWPTGNYSGTGWWGALFWQSALLAGSVAWGLRTERRGPQGPGRGRRLERFGLGALNAFAVACCALAVLGAGPLVRSTEVQYVETLGGPVEEEQSGLWLNGAPVTNLVAYDLAGQPIEGFQLFTQDGDPVTVDENLYPGLDEAWIYPVPVTTSNGTPVSNVFPIRRVAAGEADPYYCDATDPDGMCEPYAVATVQGERSLPAGSPWKDLTVTPVPAVGATLPLDENLDPIWSGVVPPVAAVPLSTAPSPAASVGPSASPSSDADEPTPAPSASAKAKESQEKPDKGSPDEG